MRKALSQAFQAARLTVGCKLNLHLTIAGVLDNGYHSLKTLFYYLPAPSDIIEIEPGEPGEGLRLFCPGFPELETKDNILARTYELFSAQCGARHAFGRFSRKIGNDEDLQFYAVLFGFRREKFVAVRTHRSSLGFLMWNRSPASAP